MSVCVIERHCEDSDSLYIGVSSAAASRKQAGQWSFKAAPAYPDSHFCTDPHLHFSPSLL